MQSVPQHKKTILKNPLNNKGLYLQHNLFALFNSLQYMKPKEENVGSSSFFFFAFNT